MKVPRNERGNTIRRFEEEARGGLDLTESNEIGVLRVLDIDQSEHPRWMVTERAELLTNHMAAEGWDFRNAVCAVATLARTVACLHGRTAPIAHRDLKPDNLFWTAAAGPLVGDFGISTWAPPKNITRQGEKVGPLFYIAPELERYDKNLTAEQACRADVYSLAKVLWHLCAAGSHPPQGPLSIGDREASLHQHGGVSSRRLRRLIDRATAHQPGDRPTMADFADELDIWLKLHPAGNPDLVPFENPHGFKMWPGWVGFDERAWARGEEDPMRYGLLEVARCIADAIADNAIIVTHQNHTEHGHDRPLLLQDSSSLVRHPDWEPDGVDTVAVSRDHQTIVIEAVLDAGVVNYLSEIQRDGHLVIGSTMQSGGVIGFPSDFAARRDLADHMVRLASASTARFQALH